MNPDLANELRRRTKRFALQVMDLCGTLPHAPQARVIANQVLRSATSVGANYRAACRSRSRAEFASRLAVVIEEADETVYWLELLAEGGLVTSSSVQELISEAEQFVRMFSSARQTTQAQRRNQN
jgi:four helix bundle protein